MTNENNTPTESEFLLIEKSLRGELSAEETERFRQALERKPEVRRFHDEAREFQDVLKQQDDRGVERIDWKKLGRSAGRLAMRNTLNFVGYIALTLLCAWAVFETDRLSTRIVMAIATAMIGLKTVEFWQDRREFADRCRALPDPEQDFGQNYIALLQKELAKCRNTWVFDIFAALFLIFLGLIGNKPDECFLVAGWCLALAVYHFAFIERRLRRELAGVAGR